jgi:hypothetical protein
MNSILSYKKRIVAKAKFRNHFKVVVVREAKIRECSGLIKNITSHQINHAWFRDHPYLAGNYPCPSTLMDYWMEITWFLLSHK